MLTKNKNFRFFYSILPYILLLYFVTIRSYFLLQQFSFQIEKSAIEISSQNLDSKGKTNHNHPSKYPPILNFLAFNDFIVQIIFAFALCFSALKIFNYFHDRAKFSYLLNVFHSRAPPLFVN